MRSVPLYSAVWTLLRRIARGNGDLAYAEFVTKWSFEYYYKRIKQIGFVGLNDVLDVGCGYGQWMLALSAANKNVIGVDIHAKRIATANSIFKTSWILNAHATVGDALKIKCPDASFDAVFCYGVFMFLDRRAALTEFHRVLRPGGRLYICTNGRGWWLKLALVNLFKNMALAKTCWNAFVNGRHGGMPNATDLRDTHILDSELWMHICVEAEGVLFFNNVDKHVEPVYERSFLGFDNVIEFVATKRPVCQLSDSHSSGVISALDRLIELGVSGAPYSFENYLRLYNFEDQAGDLVNATNFYAVERAVNLSMLSNRTDALRYIFNKVTVPHDDERSKLSACVTFAQKAFYHHFGLQPMTGENRMLLDPIASLLFGACRCGNVARFLVDLFLVNGFQARLLSGSCHTSAEVFINSRWVLADASLFPVGVMPLSSNGSLLSMEEIAAAPHEFDAWPSYLNYNTQHINLFKLRYPETYKSIEHWLRFPIYPSVAFFGKDLSANGDGYITRWVKNGQISTWEADPDYGWYDVSEIDGVKSLGIATAQRPEQVVSVIREENILSWQMAQTAIPCEIEYVIYVSRESRGWSYTSISTRSSLPLVGEACHTSLNSLVLADCYRNDLLYVTIIAKDKQFPKAFFLPSDEFVLPPLTRVKK